MKKYIMAMERIVDDSIVTNTLSNLKSTQNYFKIVFDATVKTNKYFMDLIYEGINVCTNALHFPNITSVTLNHFCNFFFFSFVSRQ